MIRKFFLPFAEIVTGITISKKLKFLEKSQWWSREKIEEYQNSKLRNLIEHAYKNVPYYRKIFKKEGITPKDIKTKEDLQKIPTLTKEDIRKNFNDMKAVNISNFIECHSSGSTGEPLKYYVTKSSYSWGWAQTFRQWGWANFSLGDPYVKISLNPRDSYLKKIQDFLMNCTYIYAFDINEKTLFRQVERIKKSKAKIIRGYASSMYLLAKYMKDFNITGIRPDAIMTTGDMLFPNYRKLIESQFKCKVFDAYGGEGMAVAFECEKHKGYHIADENVIVEFLRNDVPVTTSKISEIVLTDLNNYVMPFIRYKIRDLGRPLKKSCPCGRELSMMKSIEGRDTDIIVLPNGNYIVVHFFTILFENIEGVNQFQVIQDSIDEITIKIVKNEKFKKNDLKYITTSIKNKIGKNVRLNINFVDSIPPTKSGKRRFVISKVKPNFLV